MTFTEKLYTCGLFGNFLSSDRCISSDHSEVEAKHIDK